MSRLPQLYHELADFMNKCGDRRHPDDVLAIIIKEWIDSAVGGRAAGFQWGDLFLPDGAELRLHFLGEAHFATVENGALMFMGLPISPRAWCLEVTGTVRNPWRDILVRRTLYEGWTRASTLRKGRPKRRTTHVPERRLVRRRAFE